MDTLTTEARDALAATPDTDLLRAFAASTHLIHTARADAKADLRAQRDLIEAEILRRMGGRS